MRVHLLTRRDWPACGLKLTTSFSFACISVRKRYSFETDLSYSEREEKRSRRGCHCSYVTKSTELEVVPELKILFARKLQYKKDCRWRKETRSYNNTKSIEVKSLQCWTTHWDCCNAHTNAILGVILFGILSFELGKQRYKNAQAQDPKDDL